MLNTVAKDVEKNNSLIWFRNDLRTQDHSGLFHALKNSKKIIGVFCFNPENFKINSLDFPKTDSFRANFLIESLKSLKEELKKINISLVIGVDNPEKLISKIIDRYNINRVYLQDEWTQDEKNEDNFLKNKNIDLYKYNDQFLFHPEDVDLKNISNVFTSFRKYCEKKLQVRECFVLKTKMDETNMIDIDYNIPSLKDLGLNEINYDDRTAFPFKGGYNTGIERINYYLWESKKLSFYKKTRNGLIGKDYSSKLSSWLANGSLSPRIIYHSIKDYEFKIEKNQSTYWMIFELIWRDFFKYISRLNGNKIFKIGGILEKNYHWIRDKRIFENWINGKTPEPFVNANMLELKNTGWMSNRGRQNVASYLAKEKKIDWRWGAKYFESKLIDYDVHSNYGNWMYVSGVGNDPRDRKFNIKFQAERYDPNNKFQNLWLQEKLSLF